MFAFLRVFAFYLVTAALLTWAIFALGWVDDLELPGFEGTRTASTPPNDVIGSVAKPTGQASTDAVPKASLPREVAAAGPAVESRPAPTAPASLPPVAKAPEPPAQKTAERAPPAAELPARAPIAKAEPVKPEAARPEASKSEAKVEPIKPAPVAAETAPSSALPPPAVANAKPGMPAVPPPPAKSPTTPSPSPPVRTADLAPPAVVPPTPPRVPPAARSAAPVQVAPAQTVRWAPTRRIAGFGADALVDELDDPRRAPDDVPCIVFRQLAFKAGSPKFAPRSQAELATVAQVLTTIPGHRLEIGSRLGPGRPMVTDARLRSDRVRVVRDGLIALGVASDRLMIEQADTYERVSDDVMRSGIRVQSIGLCVHA